MLPAPSNYNESNDIESSLVLQLVYSPNWSFLPMDTLKISLRNPVS